MKDLYTVTGTVVVPAATTGTAQGVLSTTTNAIVGTNLQEIKVGDWIVDIANQERRLVIGINSPTSIVVNKAWSNATALATLNVVKKDVASIVYMQLIGDCTVDGIAITGGIDFGQPSNGGSTTKFVRPRFVTGTDLVVSLTYFDNTSAD